MKQRELYTLTLSYNAQLYFERDHDHPKHPDRKLEKMFHKRRTSSGMGIGERDIEFCYRSRSDRDKAATKARRLKLIKRVYTGKIEG